MTVPLTKINSNNVFLDGNTNESDIVTNNIKIDCNPNDFTEVTELEVYIREDVIISSDYILIKNTGYAEDQGTTYPTCTLIYYIGKSTSITIPKFFVDPLDPDDSQIYIGTVIEATCFNYSNIEEVKAISDSFTEIN